MICILSNLEYSCFLLCFSFPPCRQCNFRFIFPHPEVANLQVPFLRHCLGRQELDLGIGIVGLHQTGGVHLDPLQVDALGANGLQNCRNIQKC